LRPHPVRHRDYAVGSFIGILPSLIGFVLLGGVIAPGVQNRTLVVALSMLFMLFGFGIASALKRRDALMQTAENAPESRQLQREWYNSRDVD
jgi:uncharacterized membrane protein YdjX (TVP38/TMEM64 family)